MGSPDYSVFDGRFEIPAGRSRTVSLRRLAPVESAGPKRNRALDLGKVGVLRQHGLQLMVVNLDHVGGTVKLARRDVTAARRQQILEAACGLFFARGYEPVTLAEIGAVAGVSGPAIYRHFGSKAEILVVLCGQTIDRLIELVGPRRLTPEAELEALVKGQVRHVVRHPELVRVFLDEERSLPEPLQKEVRRREREHAQRWVDVLKLLRPEIPPGGLEMLAFCAVGAILSAPRWPRALRASPTLEADLTAAVWRILEVSVTRD